MNGRHVHTTALCVSLLWSGGLRVVRLPAWSWHLNNPPSLQSIKLPGDTAVKFLTKLFNAVCNEGLYPEEWSKAIIIQIFMKGNKNNIYNYGGISLLSLISKWYTSVLNKRVVSWGEENAKRRNWFRQGYSTTDHILTLNAIVEKSLSKRGGKLYTCFVDLKKAFDSVQHESFFNILRQNGLSGKFLKALLAILKSVKSCLRIEDRLPGWTETRLHTETYTVFLFH